MRKVLIDTNVYTAFKANQERIVKAFTTLDYIGMDITVLAELLSGFKLGTREKENRRELERFLNVPRVHLLNHDNDTAEFYSEIFREMRRKRKPIPANDIWIAAAALQHGLGLFTLDRHFADISGLLLKTDF
jgi:tRNA(fMet)-specific endonuclease VapC